MFTLIFESRPAHLENILVSSCSSWNAQNGGLRGRQQLFFQLARGARREEATQVVFIENTRPSSVIKNHRWLDWYHHHFHLGDSALGGGFVWGDSLIDVTYCIILIVYSPHLYPILFVITGDQVCLGRSPDEMAMRPPLLVNHPLPPQPWTFQST